MPLDGALAPGVQLFLSRDEDHEALHLGRVLFHLDLEHCLQVASEVVEAGRAFGSTASQLLFKIELPLAMPNIMAGVNQTIMMALAMVVIASMIGASGLGLEVLRGIERLDVGRGFVAGICIVIVAIMIDRVSQALVRTRETNQLRRE